MENKINILKMRLILSLIALVLIIPFVFASNDLTYFVTPLTADGVTQPNASINYTIALCNSTDCTDQMFNQSQYITLDEYGRGVFNFSLTTGLDNNWFTSTINRVAEFRDGVLTKAHEFGSAILDTLIVNNNSFFMGNVNVSGNVTADTYFGDGSQLSGISGGGNSSAEIFTVVDNQTFMSRVGDTSTGNYTFNDTLHIDSFRGRVGIGTDNPSKALDVVGDITLETTGDIFGGDGSESSPSYTFNADANTGMYRPTTDTLAFSGGGVEFLTLKETAQDIAVFNDDGDDIDFSVEASGHPNAFFVQGSDGSVGIGTNTPDSKLDVNGNMTVKGVTILGNNTVVMDKDDIGHANRAIDFSDSDPRLRVYSSDEAQANDYIEMYHDQSNAHISAGVGEMIFTSPQAFSLKSSSGVVVKEEMWIGAIKAFTIRAIAGATDQLLFSINDEVGNQLIITNYPNTDKDHDHAVQTDPTLYVHSDTNPDVSNNQWGSMHHNQTNLYITTGAQTGAGSGATTIDNAIVFSPRGTEQMVITNESVGIGTLTPTYPLEVKTNLSGISIWADANISAEGYITRTSVFDKSKSVWDFVKDADYYKKDNKIDHKKFYGYLTYEVPDKSRPVYNVREEWLCRNESIGEDEKAETIEVCSFVNITDVTYPHNKVEEGVLLDAEIDVLRQAVYELKQENNLLKSELCKKDGSYSWC